MPHWAVVVVEVVVCLFLLRLASRLLAFHVGVRRHPYRRASLLKQRALQDDARGDHRAALQKRLRALSIFQSSGHDRAVVATHISLSNTYLSAGDLDNSEQHCAAAYAASDKPGYERFRLEAAELMGSLRLQRGDPTSALRYCGEMMEIEQREAQDTFKVLTRELPTGPMPIGVGRRAPEVAMRQLHCILSPAVTVPPLLALGRADEARAVLQRIMTQAAVFSQAPDVPLGTLMYTYGLVDQEGKQIGFPSVTGDEAQWRARLSQDMSGLAEVIAGMATEMQQSLQRHDESALPEAAEWALAVRAQLGAVLRQLCLSSGEYLRGNEE